MAWRRYPFESMWREMEDMRREMDTLFHQVQTGGRLLPAGGLRTGCSRQSAASSGSMSANMQMK